MIVYQLTYRLDLMGEKMWLFGSGIELHNWCKILFKFKNVNCFSQYIGTHTHVHSLALISGFRVFHWKWTIHIRNTVCWFVSAEIQSNQMLFSYKQHQFNFKYIVEWGFPSNFTWKFVKTSFVPQNTDMVFENGVLLGQCLLQLSCLVFMSSTTNTQTLECITKL